MKRHPALVPLSREHHHGLVQARRLGQAADGADAERLAAATAFLCFFRTEAIEHVREEEERVFPLVVTRDGVPRLVREALEQHARLHALAADLEGGVARGRVEPDDLRALGSLLHDHIRLEERELFPLIEGERPDALAALGLPPAAAACPAGGPLVDLGAPAGRGPLWGIATTDLNATLLAWPPGGGVDEHVNDERDVLVVVLAGSGTAWVDGAAYALAPQRALVIDRGRVRRIEAGPDGLRYLTVHLRREGLRVASAPPGP